MGDSPQYDVIIIGTGAGGGTLAHRLAPSGKRVLVLERGDYLPRERDNWDSTAVFVKGKYRAPEFWLDKHGNEFPPEVNYYVGGNTKFYGAALFRLRPEDFGEVRHHGGYMAGTARTPGKARTASSTPILRSNTSRVSSS
jgi:choline dehydrogenase-like flavoprotein